MKIVRRSSYALQSTHPFASGDQPPYIRHDVWIRPDLRPSVVYASYNAKGNPTSHTTLSQDECQRLANHFATVEYEKETMSYRLIGIGDDLEYLKTVKLQDDMFIGSVEFNEDDGVRVHPNINSSTAFFPYGANSTMVEYVGKVLSVYNVRSDGLRRAYRFSQRDIASYTWSLPMFQAGLYELDKSSATLSPFWQDLRDAVCKYGIEILELDTVYSITSKSGMYDISTGTPFDFKLGAGAKSSTPTPLVTPTAGIREFEHEFAAGKRTYKPTRLTPARVRIYHTEDGTPVVEYRAQDTFVYATQTESSKPGFDFYKEPPIDFSKRVVNTSCSPVRTESTRITLTEETRAKIIAFVALNDDNFYEALKTWYLYHKNQGRPSYSRYDSSVVRFYDSVNLYWETIKAERETRDYLDFAKKHRVAKSVYCPKATNPYYEYVIAQGSTIKVSGTTATKGQEPSMSQQQLVAVDPKILQDLVESVKTIAKKPSALEERLIETVIEKSKDLATAELQEELRERLDKYIQKTYGVLPKKLEITVSGSAKVEITGLFHEKFQEILTMVANDVPIMLMGAAGTGKNYTLEQVAQAMCLDFYYTGAVTQEYKITGFIDAGGNYHETEFYKAFKNGGLFMLDEIDASSPDVLVILNGAIANRYFDFPNGRIKAHPDFRIACAGNTYGTGADMVYVGRNVLDGATLDRFVVIKMGYDENVEKELCPDKDYYSFIRDVRELVDKMKLRHIVGMRASINGYKALKAGMSRRFVIESIVMKGLTADDINSIVNNNKRNGAWHDELRSFAREVSGK